MMETAIYKRKKMIIASDSDYTTVTLPSVQRKNGRAFIRVDRDRETAIRKAKETIDQEFP